MHRQMTHMTPSPILNCSHQNIAVLVASQKTKTKCGRVSMRRTNQGIDDTTASDRFFKYNVAPNVARHCAHMPFVYDIIC